MMSTLPPCEIDDDPTPDCVTCDNSGTVTVRDDLTRFDLPCPDCPRGDHPVRN